MTKPVFHIETSAGALLKALRAVGPAIERRNTIPVLSMCCFNEGRVIGSDNDIEISSIFAVSRFEGGLCVDHARLSGLMATLDSEIEVSLKGGGAEPCVVSWPGAEYRLPSLPVSDYRVMGSDEMAETWACDNAQLGDAFRRVMPAVSTEETRYYLNGICLATWSDPFAEVEGRERVKSMPLVVATDGHRLIGFNVPGGEGFDGAIVPRKARQIVAGLGNPTEVQRWRGAMQMAFVWPGLTVRTKLIDGSFPDFERVVPKGNTAAIHLPRAETLKAIRRVQAVNTGRIQSLKVAFEDRDGGGNAPVTISTNDGDAGGTETIKGGYCEADGWSGIERHVGLNAGYLRTHYGVIGDEVPLLASDSASPLVSHHAGAVSVLMPLRV